MKTISVLNLTTLLLYYFIYSGSKAVTKIMKLTTLRQVKAVVKALNEYGNNRLIIEAKRIQQIPVVPSTGIKPY